MTLLVLGAAGQVGTELLRSLAPLGQVVAATRNGLLADGRACEHADLSVPASLTQLLDRLQPTALVNAAAYTAVDLAEQNAEAAFRVNTHAPGEIARWCAAHEVPFVHFSTDYVFDGQSTTPYTEDETTAPLSVYGRSKRDGEVAVRAAGGRHLIFRTAWVYASHGSNFLRTMLRLGADRDCLRVVADQIGSPTPARLIADITAQVLQHPAALSGTWHLTTSGQTSWQGFAQAIFDEALRWGVCDHAPTVEPITSAQYPTVAQRPSWSVLDNRKLQKDFGLTLPTWQEGLAQVMAEMARR